MFELVGVAGHKAAIRRHLDQVALVLTPLSKLDPVLEVRLQELLNSEVAKLRERVDNVDDDGGDRTELSAVRAEARNLFGEALGFLGGAVARHAGLDQGLCDIADGLVRDLRSRGDLPGPAVSVPAEREYNHGLSSLIRLRFPGDGFWDLPVVAHELAHGVVDDVVSGRGEKGLFLREAVHACAAETQDPPRQLIMARSEELFADVFATYVAGPAYAYTCLRLRFDAAEAGRLDLLDRHPSNDKRAGAILATLDHLSERWAAQKKAAGSLASTIADLREGWSNEVAIAGGDPTTEVSRDVAAAYCAVLDDYLPALRHEGLATARLVALALEKNQPRPASAGPFDVLNGAWLVRRERERTRHQFDDVAARAAPWC